MTRFATRYLSAIAIVFSFLTASAAHTGFTASVEAKKDHLPRLPGAALLAGYPPDDLEVTTEDKTFKLREGEPALIMTPSISADGSIVASARSIAGDPSRGSATLVVSTYSMSDKKWTEYKDLKIRGGPVAISPDGSKLACSLMAEAPYGLHILDLKTGNITVGPETTKGADSISWSPDGQRIVFDRYGKFREGHPETKAIFILDVEAGTVSQIAEGLNPSWSPSGEWIAFDGYSPVRGPDKHGGYSDSLDHVSLIRPDGKDSKVIAKFPVGTPVWSPDSRSILMSILRDEEGRYDTYVLDLTTLKRTRKFKATAPVYGWVPDK